MPTKPNNSNYIESPFMSVSSQVQRSTDNNNNNENKVSTKSHAMVSRRKILSRSRDDLNMDNSSYLREEDDVWYQKEKLYKDHIQEVLGKWGSIDDEIWAKVIVLERNRRVAKAYARAPVLTVNGSNDGFDGFRIGVNGFENPLRDPKTEEFKTQIGQGCKIKMDETGNILVKRFSVAGVYAKNVIEENAVANDILKLPNGLLESEKPFKLFDMKKFQQNVNRELKRQYPDRSKLESQCISTIAFVKSETELLDCPIWIMLINVVALEMLKAKMPSQLAVPNGLESTQTTTMGRNAVTLNRPNHARHSSEPRKRFLPSGSSDEDPYSLTPSGSSGSSGGKGNGNNSSREDRLPAQDKEYFGPQNWAKQNNIQRPDYSDDMDDENTLTKKMNPRTRASRKSEDKRNKLAINSSSGDDPYYCGLSARVPNFAAKAQKAYQEQLNSSSNGYATSRTSNSKNSSKSLAVNGQQVAAPPGAGGAQNLMRSPMPSRSVPNLQSLAQLPGSANPYWWHSRLYPQEPHQGIGDLTNYHYPGRMGPQGRAYRSAFMSPAAAMAVTAPQRQAMYRTGWE